MKSEQIKTCRKCKQTNGVNHFERHSKRGDKQYYRPDCKICEGKSGKVKPIQPAFLPNEIWRAVTFKGIAPYYEVSSIGRLKSKARKDKRKASLAEMITYGSGKKGEYKRFVMLTKTGRKRGIRVHQLVAHEFVDNPENKKTVNHKDGNKSNNHYLNLEWCTQKENNQHARKTGLHKGYRKFHTSIIMDIRKSKLSNQQLAKKHLMNYKYIWAIRKRIARKLEK